MTILLIKQILQREPFEDITTIWHRVAAGAAVHVAGVLAELAGDHTHTTITLLASKILLIIVQTTLILAYVLAHDVAELVLD